VPTHVEVSLPSQDKYEEGVTSAIVHLQRTFALDPSEVAARRILGVPAMESISRRDRGLLGTTAL
jgi:hypothetical protein